MLFYKHIKKLSRRFAMLFHLKVLRYEGFSSTLFELLVKIENILFLNTINILMEYKYNSYMIYQELV